MAAKPVRKSFRVLPGFGLTLGFTLLYLSLIVLIPLSATFLKTSGMGWERFWAAATSPRAIASYELTSGASLIAASVNAVAGLLVAWVLVRYTFPGKRIIDGLVDLPFALPTAVAGIALTAIYAPKGWIGKWPTEDSLRATLTAPFLWIDAGLAKLGGSFAGGAHPWLARVDHSRWRYPDGLQPARCHHRAHFHRPAFCRADGAAGARRSR